MIVYCKKAITELEDNLRELTYEEGNSLLFYEKAIELILDKTANVKKHILKIGFKNDEDEIRFFKEIKPKILSRLIYYNSIYRIETKRPHGKGKTIKKYLCKELSKIKKYFDNNFEFYKYYRTNSAYLDHKYFLRGRHDIKLNLDTFYFEADHSFSTSHDYKVAKIIANDLIQVYLEDQLYQNKQNKLVKNPSLTWTGSKAALIELMYAIHAQGVFDNGKNDIKMLAKAAEQLFNVDLGDFYHTYMELRSRKINRTKFIDALRDGLIKKMDEQDEK